MRNNWIYIINWEIKRSGRIRELSTLNKVEYECFLEYLKEHEHLFEILENYVLELVEK